MICRIRRRVHPCICYKPHMSANVEIRISVRGFGKSRSRVVGKVRKTIEDFGFLEEFETTDDDADEDADEVVFDSGGGIGISQSYEVLPRFADELRAIATNGIQIKLETRHDFDEDAEWVVQEFGA